LRPNFDDDDHDARFDFDVHELVHDDDGNDDDEHHEWRKHDHAEYVNERDTVRSHDNRRDCRRGDSAHEGGTSEGTCEAG
jgi:hypothetical protein